MKLSVEDAEESVKLAREFLKVIKDFIGENPKS